MKLVCRFVVFFLASACSAAEMEEEEIDQLRRRRALTTNETVAEAGEFENCCSHPVEFENCCSHPVSNKFVTDAEFQQICRFFCGSDPNTCCGKKPSTDLTTPNYAKECTEACKKKDKKKSGCFSLSNTVEVQGEGLVTMDSLKIGDFVRAGKDKFSRVYSFLHLDHDVEAEFLQIQAEGLKTPLEITSDHMVFVNNAPIRASQIKVGDMLGDNKVADIKSVKRRGVYAPATEAGDIVVSGALASSYAAVRSYTPINQHTEAHALFSIRRMVCAFNFNFCKNEIYTEDGFPQWLSPLISFALITRRNPLAQLFISVVGLPLIATAYTLEQSMHYPIVFVMVIVGIFTFKKIKASKVKFH
jgi:hypothetical protein